MSTSHDVSRIPVTTLASGSELSLTLHTIQGGRPGPTLGITAVIHGNEPFPSLPIVRRLLAEIDPAELAGTLLVVPVCNPLGFAELSRHTPADGMNLNAAFRLPGPADHPEPVKTVSMAIAEALTEAVLKRLDYLIDFHSGGPYHSAHMIEFDDDPRSIRMARAFGMPILLRDEWMPGQMWTMAAHHGAAVIVAELGGNGTLNDAWVQRGVDGVFNVLRAVGMLRGDVPRPPRQYVVNNTRGHEDNLHIFRPREAGLIVADPAITPELAFAGRPVEGVPVLGELLNPYDMSTRQRFAAPFARTLMLATTVGPSWNGPGDFAYILADADKAEVWDEPLEAREAGGD